MATSRMVDFDYGDDVRVVKINDDVIDLCAGTHVSNSSEIEDLKIYKFDKKGSGIFRIEAVSGKDMIKKVFKKMNKDLRNENLLPALNKIDITNKKLNELGLSSMDISNDLIDSLNIESYNYKNELIKVNNEIRQNLNLANNQINEKINEELLSKFNNEKIVIIESDIFNLPEFTKPMLSLIDGSNSDLGLVIISNKEKVTYAFILASKNINENNVNRIKEIANKNGLKGNGNRQQYIFGGLSFDNNELIKEVKKWEF